MELKNISQIQTCVKNGIKLYMVYPSISMNGIIKYDKPQEIVNCCNYRYAFYVFTKKPYKQISIYNRKTTDTVKVEPTDEINTKARVFTTIEDAKEAMDRELCSLSYTAIKYVDRTIKIIKAQKEGDEVNIKSDITTMKFSGKNALLLNEDGNLIILSCFVAGSSGNEGLYRTPIEIPVPKVKFAQIECGKDFCLLLTFSGLLYSFGSNQFGQLGHGDTEPRTYPVVVQYFLDMKKRVDQISCGFKHSACKCNNKIYSWGCNSNGQLGTGNLKHLYSPNLNNIKYSKIFICITHLMT